MDEKFRGFDDTGWDNLEEYTRNFLQEQEEKRKRGELDNIPDFPEILRKARKNKKNKYD